MSINYDEYKQIAVSIIARLGKKENAVVAISSSDNTIDISNIAAELIGAFNSMKMTADIFKPKKNDNPFTMNSAKEMIENKSQSADITLVILEPLAESSQAAMFATHCDGIILAECKNLSRTDNIDKAYGVIERLGIKGLGFILC